MAYSEAQKRATKKYQKAHYYEFKVCFPIELKNDLKEAGGESLQGYIKSLVYADMKKKGYDVPNS